MAAVGTPDAFEVDASGVPLGSLVFVDPARLVGLIPDRIDISTTHALLGTDPMLAWAEQRFGEGVRGLPLEHAAVLLALLSNNAAPKRKRRSAPLL